MAADFHLYDLGEITNKFSGPMAINNKHQVVGSKADYPEAFLFDTNNQAEPFTNLSRGKQKDFNPKDINDAGQVIGDWSGKVSLWHNSEGQLQKHLVDLPEGGHYEVHAVNVHKIIVGVNNAPQNSANGYEAFCSRLFCPDSYTNIGETTCDRQTNACDINNQGIAAGLSDVPVLDVGPPDPAARSWTVQCDFEKDTRTITATLTNWIGDGIQGPVQAFAINELGTVVGRSDAGSGWQAFFYRNGEKHEIRIPGATESRANGINTCETMVGSFVLEDSSYRAFLYSIRGNTFKDLNDYKITYESTSFNTLEEAKAINDHGEIIGYGKVGEKLHGFMMVPIFYPPGLTTPTNVNIVTP